jgi:hypothetical protein
MYATFWFEDLKERTTRKWEDNLKKVSQQTSSGNVNWNEPEDNHSATERAVTRFYIISHLYRLSEHLAVNSDTSRQLPGCQTPGTGSLKFRRDTLLEKLSTPLPIFNIFG